ncbi:cytochrome-c peroxidase [Novosphingobium guangzhouense]|uniref:Cytochrome-c peroxidase n=1 Tax=Novosphingobium guangzhouense TaxID=1850347 RepID=A0A2K2G2Q6_9SPHN|nr:cytochrome c peroxidase [Novosphingobium guangzhouense]PNU05335.1 cytochrome-c peroxidase [Novosphingobium guangzhouense]
MSIGRGRAGGWALLLASLCLVAGAGLARDAGANREAQIALGRRLFHDGDLSINGTLSCATCHDPRHSFADGVSAHPGAHGEPGLRNVPSLVNVGSLSPLTWGNAALLTLEQQARVPIAGEDPVEMGMKGQEAELTRRLSSNPCYRKLFRAAFPATRGRIDFATVSAALAAFQRTIVSHETDWDHAVRGGPALNAAAARGEALFRGKAGCAGCHSGREFTDLAFHRLSQEPAVPANGDFGLARATGRVDDRGKFRTPSLRNVALTAPYLHDGSADTLADAISRHGIAFSPAETTDIEAFLNVLTDTTVGAEPRYARPGKACELS